MRYWNARSVAGAVISYPSVCILPMRYWNGILKVSGNRLGVLGLYLTYEVLKLMSNRPRTVQTYKEFVSYLWGIETGSFIWPWREPFVVCILPMRYWNSSSSSVQPVNFSPVCILPMRYWNQCEVIGYNRHNLVCILPMRYWNVS